MSAQGFQGFLEEALQKSDADLFKELFRVYPLAVVDDYYRFGQWQNALMQMDLQLFLAHLEESGAPEPPPLDQLTLPVLPELGRILPVSEGAKPKDERVLVPVLPQPETLQILVFANKHRLDLTKAKQLLAPLDLAVREPVMSDFKPGEESH
eukprot:Skav216882  [mRNA]  locus=scaffold1042:523371:523826:+ [translate_table: standard]